MGSVYINVKLKLPPWLSLFLLLVFSSPDIFIYRVGKI